MYSSISSISLVGINKSLFVPFDLIFLNTPNNSSEFAYGIFSIFN